MINKIKDGDIIQHTPASAVVSGQPISLVNRIGIAMQDIAANETGSVLVCGTVQINKVSAQAWAQGDPIFWDPSASLFTTVGTANIIAGFAEQAALNPSSTGLLNLEPNYKQAAVQADTTAADLAALKVDFNALLAKLKAAGLMKNA
jgi:predicted RecA/RadA family phage recombinase